MSDTPAERPSEGDRDTDQLDALEAEWSAIQALGLKAQETFLTEILGPALWAATGNDLHALNRFFEKKWELFENEIYREWEVRRRQRDDRVNDLESEWLTLEDDAARQRFLKRILQHAVGEEDMKVANQFVKPKDIDLWRTWAEPLEEWESARARREVDEDVRRNPDLYIG